MAVALLQPAGGAGQGRGLGTIADIAHSLHLSQGTVRNHVSSAMLKMEARTRVELACVFLVESECHSHAVMVSL